MPLEKAARGWDVLPAKGSWEKGGVLAGCAGWVAINTPPLIKSISLTAVSNQDAVLDLPPFEKVVDKASFAGPETLFRLRRDRPERGRVPSSKRWSFV